MLAEPSGDRMKQVHRKEEEERGKLIRQTLSFFHSLSLSLLSHVRSVWVAVPEESSDCAPAFVLISGANVAWTPHGWVVVDRLAD